MKLPNDEIIHYRSDDGVTAIIERTELVRCKDCIFWNKDENVLRGICDEWSDYEDGISRYTGSDEYCSYGERKDGESDE